MDDLPLRHLPGQKIRKRHVGEEEGGFGRVGIGVEGGHVAAVQEHRVAAQRDGSQRPASAARCTAGDPGQGNCGEDPKPSHGVARAYCGIRLAQGS